MEESTDIFESNGVNGSQELYRFLTQAVVPGLSTPHLSSSSSMLIFHSCCRPRNLPASTPAGHGMHKLLDNVEDVERRGCDDDRSQEDQFRRILLIVVVDRRDAVRGRCIGVDSVYSFPSTRST